MRLLPSLPPSPLPRSDSPGTGSGGMQADWSSIYGSFSSPWSLAIRWIRAGPYRAEGRLPISPPCRAHVGEEESSDGAGGFSLPHTAPSPSPSPPHQQFLIILYFCTTLFYFLFRGRHFKLDGSFANTACLFFVLIAVCTLALLLYSYREGVRQRERDRER